MECPGLGGLELGLKDNYFYPSETKIYFFKIATVSTTTITDNQIFVSLSILITTLNGREDARSIALSASCAAASFAAGKR